MDKLEEFDTVQLEAELERRKQEEKRRNMPRRLDNPDWSAVEKMCEEYINALAWNGRPPKDADHYIYEAAMTAVFGNGVWVWINKRLR